jgi:hypothetical protein
MPATMVSYSPYSGFHSILTDKDSQEDNDMNLQTHPWFCLPGCFLDFILGFSWDLLCGRMRTRVSGNKQKPRTITIPIAPFVHAQSA